jgi:glycosyltransferase involved in cell wall biosynthesis
MPAKQAWRVGVKNPKISIIIPVYNTARFLEKCIASISSQTYQNLEIIIVNDGSTDGSGELADRLKDSDARIQVVHKENGGASTARNRGIQAASGEYLGFVDSDDYLAPEMYESLVALIERENLLMTQASRHEIDQYGQQMIDLCQPPENETIVTNTEFFRELLLHRGDASFCTKLTKASLFLEERFPEGVLNEDFYLLVRLLPKVGRIGILPGKYYHVVHNSASTTRKKSKDAFSRVFLDIVANADMIETLVAARYPALTAEAKRFALFQRLDYLLHVPVGQMQFGNSFFKDTIRYLRKNIANILKNPYLNAKSKFYLMLFTVAPRTVRRIHAAIRK